jgi:hypothetical protein
VGLLYFDITPTGSPILPLVRQFYWNEKIIHDMNFEWSISGPAAIDVFVER